MFQRNEIHVLKGPTVIGKNMIPIGSIFFPLKVAPIKQIYKIRTFNWETAKN